MTSELSKSDVAPPKVAWQFSLRALLVATFVVSCWCVVLHFAPHVAVFLLGIGLVAMSIWLRRRLRRGGYSQKVCLPASVFVILAWFTLYVLSVGPVVAIHENVVEFDTDLLEFIYAPVLWLHDETPLKEPLEDYVDGWENR